jgi:DNA-binding transcriptional MocR family regulator
MSFRASGAQLVGIDVDQEGIRTDALARTLRSRTLKLVYTTPAAQMPTGVLLSNARRQALLELADDTQTPILEDDYDSEFRFGNPPQPALKTRDRAGQVIYVGTFSKALFPTLRLGYLVAARPLLTRLATARFATALGGDALTQAAITELLASGALERHVRELRKRYTTRRAALLASLEDSMPEGTIWTEPHGGLAVWVSLPPDIDAGSVYRSAREHGIHYLRGEACYFDGRRSGSLALSFANQSPDRIAEGVARLSEIASGHRLARRSA